MLDVTDVINKFGFPVVMAVGMGYFIYYIWKFVTTELKVKLGEANTVLIGLIDQIRMLDNDLVRLQQKVNVVLEYEQRYKDSPSPSRDADELVRDVGRASSNIQEP
jgi:hypothetical protein